MSKMKNLFTDLPPSIQTKILSGQIDGNKYLKSKKTKAKKPSISVTNMTDLKKASGNDFS